MFEAKGEGEVITLMKSSDITTIYHETAHYFERTLTPEEKAHFDAIYGEYAEGRARSEAFAEGFVRWVADGWYGTKAQHGLFAKFARFVREVSKQIPDSNEANFKLTPQMQLFYRAMLGDEKAKAALNEGIKRRDDSGVESKIKSDTPSVLFQTQSDKEKAGIYKVVVNGKDATTVQKYDIEFMDDVVNFERGFERNGKGFGATHIEKHLSDGSVGQVSLKELMNIGDVIRNYDNLSIVRDDKGVKRVYEKEIGDTKFFAVIGERAKFERVITFYSDRNLQGLTANASLYNNLANSNSIIINFEPKSNISEIENEVLTAKSEKPLYQSGQEVKPEDTLFIRPTDDMKGFWQKWVDNIYKGATAIVDSKKYDDVKWVRRIRENLLLHANRGELYLDHLTEFRMRLTSGYDRAVDLGKALAKELTPIEREILTRKLA